MNPRSDYQMGVRNYMAGASQYWHTTLTAEQRILWNEYAQSRGSAASQTGPNSNGGCGTKNLIPGNGGVMSGFNAFCANSTRAYSAGIVAVGTYVADPLIGVDAPNAPTGFICTYCDDTGTKTLRFAWVDPVVAPVGSVIRIWAKSLDAGVHRQILTSIALAVQTADVTQVRVALGQTVAIETVPGHYHFQLDCISPSGKASPPSNICQAEVTVAAPDPC